MPRTFQVKQVCVGGYQNPTIPAEFVQELLAAVNADGARALRTYLRFGNFILPLIACVVRAAATGKEYRAGRKQECSYFFHCMFVNSLNFGSDFVGVVTFCAHFALCISSPVPNSSRYPTPCTVFSQRGLSGSGSILARSPAM